MVFVPIWCITFFLHCVDCRARPRSRPGNTYGWLSPSSPLTAWPSTWRSVCLLSPTRLPRPPHPRHRRRPSRGLFPSHFGFTYSYRLQGTTTMYTAFAAAKAALVAAVPLAHPLPSAVLSLATNLRLAATRFLQSPYSDRSDLRFESLLVKEIRRVLEFREIKTVDQ
jgi:hypothetical protein